MAQSVSLWGATYNDVPAIEVPKSGGGMASFTDVTDTTAIASDVLSGKYFYTAAGEKTLGTGTGGIDGNNLEYGFTDGSLPLVGIAKVDSAHVWDDQLQMMIFGTGQIGTGRVV